MDMFTESLLRALAEQRPGPLRGRRMRKFVEKECKREGVNVPDKVLEYLKDK